MRPRDGDAQPATHRKDALRVIERIPLLHVDFGYRGGFAAVLIAWVPDTADVWAVDSFMMEAEGLALGRRRGAGPPANNRRDRQ